MKKVGFICEGLTEFILLRSDGFKNYLASLKIEIAYDVIDAHGCGNLLPHNRNEHIKRLEDNGAEVIIILTDLDNAACITLTKNRIQPSENSTVVIAVKEIESWFLANTKSMRVLLGKSDFDFEFPENEINPFKTIYNLLVDAGKGSFNKKRLVTNLLRLGFDLNESAAHPNCPSAKYFIDKLESISPKE